MLKRKRKKFGFEIYLEVGREELLTIRIVVHHQNDLNLEKKKIIYSMILINGTFLVTVFPSILEVQMKVELRTPSP